MSEAGAGTGSKTRFEVRRERTYLELLDAGMRELVERGYEATTVEGIVARTGHTRGAFYFHFRNKQDFFLHVVEYRQRFRVDWWRTPDDHDAATTSLVEVLAIARRHLDAAMLGLGGWVLVMVGFHQAIRHDPEARAAMVPVYERWLGEIERFVAALQAGGWVPADRDARRLAARLFAYTEGAEAHAALYGFADLEALLEGYALLLAGELR